jgi:hypothetical protein
MKTRLIVSCAIDRAIDFVDHVRIALSVDVKNSSNVNLYAAIGASNYLGENADPEVTRNYIIQDDKRAIEITSLNETELVTWVPGSPDTPSSDAWLRGDDAGGAITALSWLDENGSPDEKKLLRSVQTEVDADGAVQ